MEEDILLLAESIADVLTDECDSLTLHKFYNGELDLGALLWSRAAELGWTAIGLPEAHGGLGMGEPGLAALFGALGSACAPGPFLGTLPAAQWLAEIADPVLAADLLPRVIAGELEFAVPAGPDGAALRADGEGISGRSDLLISSPGASIAIVPVDGGFALLPLDAAGVRQEGAEMWDRTRHLVELECSDVAPIARIEDADGAAARLLFRHLALAVGAESIGGGRRIAAQTVDYLKTREQFGRPLASFQALKHRVANLMFALEAADEQLQQAVERTVDGDPHAAMWVAIGKAAASDAYKAVADDCLQLHGGVGFTWEFDPHIHVKRALLGQALAGDNMKLRDSAADHLYEASLAGTSTAELAI